MNPSTRISIHCYQGDGSQVAELLPLHRTHQCPITVMSPEDSPVTILGAECRHGGKRQSKGQLSLDRQRRHMEMLLEYPEDFFLMHDADSICLSPELPQYLYDSPNVLWSNLVLNQSVDEVHRYPAGIPRLAFQPPYFISRPALHRLLSAADKVKVNPGLPYIDHYMVQLAVSSRVPFRGFPDGYSGPICTHPGYLELAQIEVKHKGRIFIHSVKGPKFWLPLMAARKEWVDSERRPGDNAPNMNTDTTADVGPRGLMRAQWTGDTLAYLGERG